MNKPLSLPLDGRCRCAQTAFRVTANPIFTTACHCTGCQRMSASAFSLTAMFPCNAFFITQGEPIIGGLHGEPRHFFCPHCKSWMFSRAKMAEQFVNVRPTLFDDASWFMPFMETYTCEKLSWASTPARHSFERFPDIKDFLALATQFAAES